MKRLLLLFPVLLFGCGSDTTSSFDPTEFVDPFIGTGGHGHTFPGATLPNGMVQLSPDTRMEGWDACSGYHYSDNTIIGFSHTHLSGTGCGDYGDILLIPTTGTDRVDREGYTSLFSHDSEIARPGYYSVMLDSYGVQAELTATAHTGMHRYTFPASDDAAIILDPSHSLQNNRVWQRLEVTSDREIVGIKRIRGWGNSRVLYFVVQFSKPIENIVLYNDDKPVSKSHTDGSQVKARLSFKSEDGEQIVVKVGLSAVDIEGARLNMKEENAGWDFDAISRKAHNVWRDKLSKIEVESSSDADKRIFYTALYHSYIAPNIFSDVDGRYRGQDRDIHHTDGKYYAVFSLWDTFRALHPLLTIIEPDMNGDFVETLLRKYDEGGQLPMWDLASNYTGCMIGYHAVSVIAEAYIKGNGNFDAEKALEACIKASEYHHNTFDPLYANLVSPIGIKYKNELGYIPSDKDNQSVAKALEYAYNDWCISVMARAMGKNDIADEYAEKALYYKKYFDPSVGFMRGIDSKGQWRTPFDPTSANHFADDYTEGNAYQWSWFAPHDVEGLIELYGGKDNFIAKLDDLFSTSAQLSGEFAPPDISGLIGQYAHGNEPSHHTVHLYNYADQPWRTQELVDSILFTLYSDTPDGLSGNEDCGQMSAWYILNAMGIYSVAPASGVFSFGRPIFDSITIDLPKGKKLTIVAHNNSRDNKYVESIVINGEQIDKPFIDYETLMAGGTIEFTMGNTRQK